MTAVKVGDRVRLTLEDSVIVGTVADVVPHAIGVRSDGSTRSTLIFDDWTVVGTIVRDKDGDAWQRHAFGWRQSLDDVTLSLADLQWAHGLLTVLWTPEATQ